jgi:S-adenosylmethionine uptake transporter
MMTDNPRAAIFMMAGSSAFAVNDTFLKLMGSDLGMFQILAMRGIAVSLIFAGLVWLQRDTLRPLGRRDRLFLGLRSGAEMGAAFFFFRALFDMPLAAITAIIQVVPLTVAFAAYLFLKEPLGWRRLSAILIGFGGVLLIVRPGTDAFTGASVDALLCVAMVTLRDLTTRVMAKAVPSSLVALTTALGVTLLGGVGSITERWVAIDPLTCGWLAGTVIFTVAGYYLVILAMRTGELTFVAPFRYAALLAALVLGWSVLGEWPSTLTLLGSAVVVATGVYTLYREGRAKRRMIA